MSEILKAPIGARASLALVAEAATMLLCVLFLASSPLRAPGIDAPRSVPSLRGKIAKEVRVERHVQEDPVPKPPPEPATEQHEVVADASTVEDEPVPERRFDEDGGAYTKEEFLAFYGEAGHEVGRQVPIPLFEAT